MWPNQTLHASTKSFRLAINCKLRAGVVRKQFVRAIMMLDDLPYLILRIKTWKHNASLLAWSFIPL